MEFTTQSTEETQRLGRKIGSELGGQRKIFALSGDLGSGKTTFTQGFAKGLGVGERVISPTFILMRSYKLKKAGFFYHLDLYRLEKGVDKEILNLGLFDIWKDEKSIIIIEWAEKIKGLLPKETVWVEFKNLGGERRQITLKQ